MSYSLNAAGHVPATLPDGTAQDAAAVELELYEELRAVLEQPKYGCNTSSFGGSHTSGSLHLADADT